MSHHGSGKDPRRGGRTAPSVKTGQANPAHTGTQPARAHPVSFRMGGASVTDASKTPSSHHSNVLAAKAESPRPATSAALTSSGNQHHKTGSSDSTSLSNSTVNNTVAPLSGNTPQASALTATGSFHNASVNAANDSGTASHSGHSAPKSKPLIVIYGPANNPQVMNVEATSALPARFLDSLGKTRSKVVYEPQGGEVVYQFDDKKSSYWCNGLTRVVEYLQTGACTPFNPFEPLEVVDEAGNKLQWNPAVATGIATTESTNRFFRHELDLYTFATMTGYEALQAYSVDKICTSYPLFDREVYALLDKFANPELRVVKNERMRQFIEDIVAANMDSLANDARFTEVFHKAMDSEHVVAYQLQKVQERELSQRRIESLLSNLSMPKHNSTPPTQVHTGPASNQVDKDTAFLTELSNHIRSQDLVCARFNGYGTLLPADLDPHVNIRRNEDFRFREGDIFVVDRSTGTFVDGFSGHNIVVKTKDGQRGEILRSLVNFVKPHIAISPQLGSVNPVQQQQQQQQRHGFPPKPSGAVQQNIHQDGPAGHSSPNVHDSRQSDVSDEYSSPIRRRRHTQPSEPRGGRIGGRDRSASPRPSHGHRRRTPPGGNRSHNQWYANDRNRRI